MNGSRYHAELKLMLMGKEARINVFADTLADIFADLGTIVSQFPDDTATSQGKRDIANAQLKAAQLQSQAKPHVPTQDHEVPTCVHCGAWQNMKLIEFTSKNDGKLKRAWKCQACKEWHYPDRK